MYVLDVCSEGTNCNSTISDEHIFSGVISTSSSISTAYRFSDYSDRCYSSGPSTVQKCLREFEDPVTQMWEAYIPFPPRLLPHLQWWLQRSNLLTGVPLDPPEFTLTRYTNASLTAWGAFLEGRTVSEVWEYCHLEEQIHRLGMGAALLSLRHFQWWLIFRIKGELTPFLCIFYAEKLYCYATVSRQCGQWDMYWEIWI
jgi:hypothetical protein